MGPTLERLPFLEAWCGLGKPEGAAHRSDSRERRVRAAARVIAA
jgi:hypothetical protein